jgi:hypothetical protein
MFDEDLGSNYYDYDYSYETPLFDIGNVGYDPAYDVPSSNFNADLNSMGDVGNLGITQKDGKYYQNGEVIYDTAVGGVGSFSKLLDSLMTPSGLGLLAGLGAAGYSLSGGSTPNTGGYKGSIPKYTSVRQAVEQPEYVPYSGNPAMGRRRFTDVQYVGRGDPVAIEAAKQTASNQAGILANYTPRIAAPAQSEKAASAPVTLPNINDLISKERNIVAEQNRVGMASGGITQKPRYLRGQTDGMADKIPSSIDERQAAKLSHGEFVIPADVVSHLGNGNSDAGADVLYKMMDRIRKARTGTTKQGKRINPEKFTPGGIAGYASGGDVKAFNTGGSSGTTTTTNPFSAFTNTSGATTSQSLAPWVGDYVTDYLGRGQALASEPYQAYTGPLTAGASPLQTQAFEKAAGIGGTFDSAAAAQYMNPYIQNALQPQLNELRRQSEINQQTLSGNFAKAGALGGARNAIAQSEGIRNLLNQQSGVIGSAYKDAYDKAMGQYNVSRRQELEDLGALSGAGTTQRSIEQAAIDAQKAAFEAEREDPYQKLKFEQSLLTGLPLSTTVTTPNKSGINQIGEAAGLGLNLYDLVNKVYKP